MTPLFPNDEQLVLAVIARHPRAIDEFVRRFRPIFVRDVRAVGRHRLSAEAAEDLVQEILLRVLRDDLRTLRAWQPAGGRSLRSFLSWSARQQARSALRSERRRSAREQPYAGAGVSDVRDPGRCPARAAEERQSAGALLAALKPTDRRLARMLLIEETPAEEASDALGLSRMTLYKRKQRVLERLRELADEPGRGPGAAPALAA